MNATHITPYLASLSALYSQGITTEHSFRGALETLLKNMTGFSVVNEARHIDCGAPDLTLLKDNIPVGFVEAKDVGKNLNSKDYKNQFDRYKKALDNLIITDYLTFQLFEGDELVAEVHIGEITNKGITPLAESFNKFIELIRTFSQYNGKSIANSKQLAEFMAAKTQLLAEGIEKTMVESGKESSLSQQLDGFKEVLLPTMTGVQFADIYAQTIAYGMFVARLQDNADEKFSRQKAASLIPQSNPFLRKLFQYIAGYDLDENIKWMVDSLADMFNYMDITAIHKEFDSKDKDPFLHFYEDFLTKYDKNLKNARGAYYTPMAVVKFIVQAVDDILRSEFGIANGLADNSTIPPLNPPSGGKQSPPVGDLGGFHKVQILDPATGTGTFLAEVVRNIHRRFENNAGMWDEYVKNHLIPRLNGFEIMMAPYTMAHLKLEVILRELGYNTNNSDRLHVYLTDSLENPQQHIQQIPFAQWLSNEAIEAAQIKNNAPVMVVLGNPPYRGESSNNGTWIKSLIGQYKKEPQNPSQNIPNTKWINNDYVKFIRFGQHFIDKNEGGVLAYITANSFLSDGTFRGMRHNLMKSFDDIYILDLHGSKEKQNLSKNDKDENVFDIGESVSINIFIKTRKKKNNELGKVFYSDIFGKQQEKYNFLLENNLQSIHWTELRPQMPNFFFVPKDFSLRKEYEKGFKINELLSVNSQGIVPSNKHFTIQNNKKDLENAIKDFLRLDKNEAIEKYHLETSTGWTVEWAKQNLTNSPDFANIVEYNDYPFDIKYTYFSEKSNGYLTRPRGEVMRNFVNKQNIGLVVAKECMDDWKYVFITDKITSLNLTAGAQKYGACFVFPLYLYVETIAKGGKRKVEKVPNLNAANLTGFENLLGFIPTPEQIFDYIYAILHSPSYREKYKEFLKIDFPHIPYPQDAEQFNKLVAFGEKLRHLHLMENITVPSHFANFPKQGDNKVENSFTEKSNAYKENKVWINDSQYFDNVPEIAWKFYIGGYQPAQKWLKDRKGRTLTYEDIEHYQKIIFVLNETDEIMKEIDLIL